MLATSDELLQTLGQAPEIAGSVQEVLDGAIARATFLLGTQLDTSFAPQLVEDLFTLEDRTRATLKGFLRLRLANGCVRRDVPLVVSQSDQFDGDYTPLDGSFGMVDLRKGFLQVDPAKISGAFLKVSYASGFLANETIPGELKQAVLCSAPLLLLSSSSVSSGESAPPPNATKAAKSLAAIASDMAYPYYRGLGAVLKPLASTTSDYAP